MSYELLAVSYQPLALSYEAQQLSFDRCSGSLHLRVLIPTGEPERLFLRGPLTHFSQKRREVGTPSPPVGRDRAEIRNTLLVIVGNSIIVLLSFSAMYLRNLSHRIVLTHTVSSHS